MEPLTLPDPDDRDAWEATNTFFSSHLVPHLMSLDDPDAINGELTLGMYSFFSKTYGLQPSRTPKAVRRRKKHDRRVRKLREVKNAIRRDYRKALRTHQPLNDDIKRNAQAAARALKNFWGYVNHLLGENPAVA